MKNIEKRLTNYAQGKGPKVPQETLCSFAQNSADDANLLLDILFDIINNELDNVTGQVSLHNVRELLRASNIIIVNIDEVNRKIVERKVHKLYEKVDRLKRENKNKFIDLEVAYKELDKTLKVIEKVADEVEGKDTKQYDFMNYLADTIKNIGYIEYTLKKMPGLVNVKDKKQMSLLQNIIIKYIESIKDADEENILYYNNLISLILSQRALDMKENDKRKLLETIYLEIDKMSIKKRDSKRNSKKIDRLRDLVSLIQGVQEKEAKIDTIASKYNISVYFDEDVLSKAKLIKDSKVGEMTDRKVVDDYIITIDGENSLEIDDGLSCRMLPNGNYLLGVHIASVLGYLPYESDMVKEAISRARSIYLPKKYQTKDDDFNRAIPIFPYEFSAKAASLLEGEKRLARSYYFEIDNNGNIVDEKFLKTIITSNKMATYEEIDDVIKKGCSNRKLYDTVFNLKRVAEILDRKYRAKDIYEQIKENVDDFSDLRVKKFGSQKIVYQTMLLTGNRVAEFFYKNNYPCLYRVHEVNEENMSKLESMVNNLNKTYGGGQFKKLYELISGVYPNGWYDTKGSHYGLGLDHYCHCTSGLRRSADIVVEHCLEVCYDKEPTKEELAELAVEIEARKTEINSKQSPIDWFIKEYKRTYQRRH